MRARRTIAAFSLIEVLIAVVILALGLLGVGAVIPVIIRAQREASSSTLAVVVLQDAESAFRARRDLVRLRHRLNPNEESGLGVLVLDDNWSPTGRWQAWANNRVDLETGDCWLEGNGGADVDPVYLKTKDRLWPTAGAPTPRLVWDVILRRSRPNDPDPKGTPPQQGITDAGYVQVAVFVRRVDPNIRVPGNLTLARVLTDPLVAPGQRRAAVGADPQGYPTFNGLNGSGQRRYAMPRVTSVEFDPTKRDRLEITGTAEDLAVVAQVGQKLVDNLGNVYTVTAKDPVDAAVVRISPEVPAWVPDPANSRTTVQMRLDQVAFTAQVPAGVAVFELTVTD